MRAQEALDTLAAQISVCTKCELYKGRYLIEQAFDNPRISRPSVREYLQAFKESNLECLQQHPIRSGGWWMLYLIRYGVVPKRWFHRIALWELMRNRKTKEYISNYNDYLFLIRRP